MAGCFQSKPAANSVSESAATQSEFQPESALGFESPEAVLNAFAAALMGGDKSTCRSITLYDEDLAKRFSSGEDLEIPRGKYLAEYFGLNNALVKQFPTELEASGNMATIVCLYQERQVFAYPTPWEDKFRRWRFVRSGGEWYLNGCEVGPASELPAQYIWDKSIENVSEEMTAFMSHLDGTRESVVAAIESNMPNLPANARERELTYPLSNPVVVGQSHGDDASNPRSIDYMMEATCFSRQLKFQVSWQNGVITRIVPQ